MAAVDAPTPSGSRRRSPEVIDVDAFDNEVAFLGYRRRDRRPNVSSAASSSALDAQDEVVYLGYRRSTTASVPARRRAADIVADDEVNVPGGYRSNRRRLASPPPQPVQSAYMPPVPPIPPHLREGSPIFPRAQPYEFEAHIHQPVRRASPNPPPLPAPPSHHQPVMGFGGALLAANRPNPTVDLRRRPEERRRFSEIFWAPFQWFRNLGEGDPFELGGPDVGFAAPFGDFEGIADNLYDIDFLASRPFGPPALKEPMYKPEYTHPGKTTPGFTFDFASAESSIVPGSSSADAIVLDDDTDAAASTPTTVFACAQCLGPLVQSANSTLDKEEMKNQKIWALRCGHMFDGKCIHVLMRPVDPPLLSTYEQCISVPDPKGKGKATISEDAHTEAGGQLSNAERAVERAMSDRKGKRMADMVSPELSEANSSIHEHPANSIRSRLRSYTSQSYAPVGSDLSFSSAVAASPLSPRPTKSLPRRRGQGQGKGRARAEQAVETVHEWACPVSDCGRIHASVYIGGEWKMDQERGAVAVFV